MNTYYIPSISMITVSNCSRSHFTNTFTNCVVLKFKPGLIYHNTPIAMQYTHETGSHLNELGENNVSIKPL